MTRRLLNLLSVLSLLLCVTVVVLWVLSYRSDLALPPEIGRGSTAFINWRGQVLLVHHAASPEPAGPTPVARMASLRGTWGTTTAHLGSGPTGPQVLIKGLLFDPDAAPGSEEGLPHALLARPYFLVPLAEGCTPANGFGFANRSVSLPTTGIPATYLPLWQRIGTVIRAVAVPH